MRNKLDVFEISIASLELTIGLQDVTSSVFRSDSEEKCIEKHYVLYFSL